jgi:hypothetical protein
MSNYTAAKGQMKPARRLHGRGRLEVYLTFISLGTFRKGNVEKPKSRPKIALSVLRVTLINTCCNVPLRQFF